MSSRRAARGTRSKNGARGGPNRAPAKAAPASTPPPGEASIPIPEPVARTRVQLPAAMVSFGLFIVYLLTACRTVGPGDSGELTVVMSRWGVAHAPGFPLLSLIGNLVSLLPHPGEPALPLNLLSAVFAALACGVLVAAVVEVGGNVWGGVVAGVALGTSRPFWQHALVAEVFTLNALMGALLLYLLARFRRGVAEGAPAWWTLPASALVLSTIVTHHTTLVLLGAPVVVAFVLGLRAIGKRSKDRDASRRALLLGVVAGLAGLTILLYIPIAASRTPPLSWGDARDVGSIIGLLLRQDFGSGTLMSPMIVIQELLENGAKANPLPPRHLLIFLRDVPASFGWLFPVLLILGIVWMWRRARWLLVPIVGFLVLLGLFFMRVNTPVLPLYLGVVERMYILPHTVLAFVGGLGASLVVAWVARARPRAAMPAGAACVLGTAVALAAHGSYVDMHRNTYTRDFGVNLLRGLPANTLILSAGDLFTNSMAYAQADLGVRRDVAVVDQEMMATTWYPAQAERRGMLRMGGHGIRPTDTNSIDSRTLLDLNIGRDSTSRREIVTVSLFDKSYKPAYRLEPFGLWSRVVPRGERIDLGGWADSSAALVRGMEFRSLRERYHETTWEHSESVFYTAALARAHGLAELVTMLEPGRTPPNDFVPPAAAAWEREHRADLLGLEADFMWTCMTDSLLPPDHLSDLRVAGRALERARESIAIDPKNQHGLQAAAAIMGHVPSLGDPKAEAMVRARLVEQRPGDLEELMPLLRLVLRLDANPATADTTIDRLGRQAHQRFLSLLDVCTKVYPHPQLVKLRSDWSVPLEDVPGLR